MAQVGWMPTTRPETPVNSPRNTRPARCRRTTELCKGASVSDKLRNRFMSQRPAAAPWCEANTYTRRLSSLRHHDEFYAVSTTSVHQGRKLLADPATPADLDRGVERTAPTRRVAMGAGRS